MKNKKIITLIATLGLITCLHTKVDAVKFYDTLGTRYEGAVERLAELEIIEGVTENTFNANRSITRAEFAKLIVESSLTEDEIWALTIEDDKCNFTDVSKDAWYYQYVVAAANYGYINGYEDNTFKPNKEVTYEEAAKMFMKALGHTYLVETDPRGWSAEYMDKLYSLNISDGTAEFKKGDNATRGNVAIMLWNTLTSNVWEKIWLNDVTGFTFVDSGKTLFDRITSGYVYRKDLEIAGFKEVDGKLCVMTSNSSYYKLFDQNITVDFTMIGGKTDVLYKIVRYPQNDIRYEIVGLSPDIGAQLYEGTLSELKEEGLTSKIDSIKISSDANYGYVIKAEEKEDKKDDKDNSRVLNINTKCKRFIVDKISIETETETIEDEEDDVTIKDADDLNYLYINKYETVVKKFIINEEYEIQDGAVLFENNKRVEWDTVKEGDIISEIAKDKYYFVSRKEIDVTVEDVEKRTGEIEFKTSEGNYLALRDTEYIEYYSVDNAIKPLINMDRAKLNALIGTKIKLHLDFADNIARVEFLENYDKTEPDDSLEKLAIGYYYSLDYGSDDKNNVITLVYDGKKKAYRTALTGVSVELGELVICKLEKNEVKEVKSISSGTKINEKLKVEMLKYEQIQDSVKTGNVIEDFPIYSAKYFYDFGEYNKVVSFEIQKIKYKELENLNQDKVEYYAVCDEDERINIILIMDYSEQKDVFYGKVKKIYSEDNGTIKAKIGIFDYKDVTYSISGLVNCEEGDVVSFKMLTKDSIKVLEKYTPDALGYYKDIIVKDIKWDGKVEAERGEIDIAKQTVTVDGVTYKFSELESMLLTVEKDENGLWKITKGDYLTPKQVRLKDNDRIAVNEIEDTMIIYRGYTE